MGGRLQEMRSHQPKQCLCTCPILPCNFAAPKNITPNFFVTDHANIIARPVYLYAGRSRCQVCRAMGERGSYGPNNTREPPRAKITCYNPTCGGISLCSVECSNVWHYRKGAE